MHALAVLPVRVHDETSRWLEQPPNASSFPFIIWSLSFQHIFDYSVFAATDNVISKYSPILKNLNIISKFEFFR